MESKVQSYGSPHNFFKIDIICLPGLPSKPQRWDRRPKATLFVLPAVQIHLPQCAKGVLHMEEVGWLALTLPTGIPLLRRDRSDGTAIMAGWEIQGCAQLSKEKMCQHRVGKGGLEMCPMDMDKCLSWAGCRPQHQIGRPYTESEHGSIQPRKCLLIQ